MKRTPRQQRAQRYALFRLTGIALWLGWVMITGELAALLFWVIGAAALWPINPDWRT